MIKRAKRGDWVFRIQLNVMPLRGLFQKLANEGQMGPLPVILGGPFSRKGVPQKVFELIGTDCSMRKRTFIDALPPFWNILGR